MKIILSRKGFDSGYGKQPSPILPDGTLLSLPIPIEGDKNSFEELVYNDKSYLKIIQELRPATKINALTNCHLDPDIRKNAIKRHEDWKAIFGQCEAAQTHLKNNNVSLDDIFLFFGWFKQTEVIRGKLKYKYGSPDLHIIYGYLQIGEIYKLNESFPSYSRNHIHCTQSYSYKKNNCIYVAKDKLSFNEKLNGAGCLKFNSNLVLTKKGMSRGKWELPDFFKELKITYHFPHSFIDGYFKSVDKGQEFVIEPNDKLLDWAQNLIEKN